MGLRHQGPVVAARYAAWVVRRAWIILLVALALAVAGALLALRLPLHTDFTSLLPDAQPAVVALRALAARKPSSAVIEIGVASPSPAITRRFASDLATALRRELPPELLSAVEEDDSDLRRFIWNHRHLYASRAELQDAIDGIAIQLDKVSGLDLGLDEDPPASNEARRTRAEVLRGKLAAIRASHQRPPGYVGEQGRLRMLVLRCPFGDTEPEKTAETLRRLAAIVASLSPKRYHQELAVGWCGDPVSSAHEHDLVLRDVARTVLLCLALVIAALLLYFRSPRGVLALTLTLGVGCCLTFGLTRLWIGHLNTTTAFLGSIVAGNGINFGIILMARVFEEQRGGLSLGEALSRAIACTAVPTLVASAAAGAAYLSLTITTFRGFSEFGVIAGSGMVLCWIASYLVLPALLSVLERQRPLCPAVATRGSSGLRPAIPRSRVAAVLAIGIVLGTAGLSVIGAAQLWRDPFEDDLRALRSRSYPESPTGRWSRRLDAAFGRDQSGGFYIGVQRAEDVGVVVRAIRDAERGTPVAERQHGTIDALSEVLPGSVAEQREKIALCAELGELVDRVARRVKPGTEDARLLADLRPPPAHELRPIGFQDLPPRVQRAFTERNGRTGLLVAVHPAPAMDNTSLHGVRRAVAALRAVRLPDDVRASASVSGSEVIFVEVMDAVEREGPRAAALSFGLVLLLLFLALGPRGGMALTAFALSVGVFGMLGLLALLGVRLNFLSIIAIPITIGIGVDYPFNVVARFRQEGWRSSPGVWRTAGAVAVCSATTIIGYAVLLLSDTGAIRSFGAAAVLGELTTLAAALVVVPALVFLRGLFCGSDLGEVICPPRSEP